MPFGHQPPNPERIRLKRAEAEKRLRQARSTFGRIVLRCQPYIKLKPRATDAFQCLVGEALMISVDEAIDVWDLLADTVRFWRAWRPNRRRTDAGQASARRALEIWERCSEDLKP